MPRTCARRTYKNPFVNRCVEAIRNGEGVAALSRRTGVTRETLYKWAKRNGVTEFPRPERWSPVMREQVIALRFIDGFSWKTIAKATGMPLQTVRTMCRSHISHTEPSS